jgi:hypothetical protein
MGSSSSKNKTNQTINNNIVNSTTMEMINENIMNASVNTLINNAQTCSSSTTVNNNCAINNSTIAGDLNLTSNQTSDVKTNFSCVQASKSAADMSMAMMQQLSTQLDSMSDTDVSSLMNALTDSQQTMGAATLGASSSNNTTNLTSNTNVRNDVNSIVKNKFETNLSNNFTQDTVSNCINKTDVSNDTTVSGVTVGGNANVACNQYNTVESVTHCEQLADSISKTTSETLNDLGLKVATENTTSTQTTAESVTKSENTSTGVLQDFAGVVDSFTGLFAAFGLAAVAPYIGICCCVLILICCVFMVMKGMGGGDDGGDGSADVGTTPDMSAFSQTGGFSIIGSGNKMTLQASIFDT